jgi:hypothetical protein
VADRRPAAVADDEVLVGGLVVHPEHFAHRTEPLERVQDLLPPGIVRGDAGGECPRFWRSMSIRGISAATLSPAWWSLARPGRIVAVEASGRCRADRLPSGRRRRCHIPRKRIDHVSSSLGIGDQEGKGKDWNRPQEPRGPPPPPGTSARDQGEWRGLLPSPENYRAPTQGTYPSEQPKSSSAEPAEPHELRRVAGPDLRPAPARALSVRRTGSISARLTGERRRIHSAQGRPRAAGGPPPPNR